MLMYVDQEAWPVLYGSIASKKVEMFTGGKPQLKNYTDNVWGVGLVGGFSATFAIWDALVCVPEAYTWVASFLGRA